MNIDDQATIELETSALLFDSDGVLVDSHLDGRRAWEQLSAEFGFALDDAVFETLAGVRPADSLRRFVPAVQLDAAIQRLEDLEVDLASNTPACNGARDLLESLPRGRRAIATSASRRLALARWDGAAIPVPDVVVSAEDVTSGKPHPEPYEHAADALGVDAGQCVVFEDSDSGGRSGIEAGAVVVAVGDQPWSFEPAHRIRDLRAVQAIQSTGSELTLRMRVSGPSGDPVQ